MTAYQFSQPWLSVLGDKDHGMSASEWAHLRQYLQGIDDGTISIFNLHALNATIDAGTIAGYLKLIGGTMSGAIAMGSNKVTGLAAASANGDALRYEQLFGGDLTIIGDLVFNPTTKGVRGTTTNGTAAAGNVGEIIESVVGLTNYPTSTQYGDLTSITLGAGNWLIDAQVYASANGATVTIVNAGVSTTSGNSTTGLVKGDTRQGGGLPTATYDEGITLAGINDQLSGSTIYYLKYNATYTIATPQAAGRLTAMRIS